MRHTLPATTAALLALSPAPLLAQDAAPAEPVAPTPTRLRVLVTPEDATISIADDPVGKGTAELSLLPGTHVVRVTREGYTSQTETILLAEDNPSDIILRIHLSKTPAPPPAVSGRTGGVVESLGDSTTLAGGVGLGLGIGLIATSVALATSSAPAPACSPSTPITCGDRDNLAGWSALTGATGGVLLAAGASLLVWDALAGSPASVSLAPQPGGAHASLRWRF
jgi:hypothetical protein